MLLLLPNGQKSEPKHSRNKLPSSLLWRYSKNNDNNIYNVTKTLRQAGSSDVTSFPSSKSSKSKIVGLKKECKVRLLEASDDEMEEQRIWQVPPATVEATMFTPVEPLNDNANNVGDPPQSTTMYVSRQNIKRNSFSFSDQSKTTIAPYTSNTYLPDTSNSRKSLVQGQYYPNQKNWKIVVKKSMLIVTDRTPH